MKRTNLFALLIAVVAMSLMGCEQKGPAEEAGAKIDEAIEKAGDKLEEAGDAIEKKTDN